MQHFTSQGRHKPLYEPAVYRIRVSGRLEAGWQDIMAGMALSVRETEGREPVSDLLGALPDQAALMGVLDALYGAGFPLLSVEYLGTGGHTAS